MIFKKALMAVAAAATLIVAGANGAAAADKNGDGVPDRFEHRAVMHDRYWRPGFHGYVNRDRVFVTLRHHHYARFVGNPYFYRGHYVVRSYNRFGRVVFVEVNPYTGGFIGEIAL
jgi:hypothetical protein